MKLLNEKIVEIFYGENLDLYNMIFSAMKNLGHIEELSEFRLKSSKLNFNEENRYKLIMETFNNLKIYYPLKNKQICIDDAHTYLSFASNKLDDLVKDIYEFEVLLKYAIYTVNNIENDLYIGNIAQNEFFNNNHVYH